MGRKRESPHIILISRQGSSEVDLPLPPPPMGNRRSNWWKGQPVCGRVHPQISPRTAEATCQLLPIVGVRLRCGQLSTWNKANSPSDVMHTHNIIPTLWISSNKHYSSVLNEFCSFWTTTLLNRISIFSSCIKLGMLNVPVLLKQPSPAPYYFIHNPLASPHGTGQIESTTSPRQTKSRAGRAEAPNEGSSKCRGEEGKQS